MRTYMIDWLLHVTEYLGAKTCSDKSLVFQAMCLLDRYLAKKRGSSCHKDIAGIKEYQLMAVTSLFIVSKLTEIEPIDLETCSNVICYRRFHKSRFVRMESEIVFTLEFRLDSPSISHFLGYFFTLLRHLLSEYKKDNLLISDYLLDCETLALDFSLLLLSDLSLQHSLGPNLLALLSMTFSLNTLRDHHKYRY